MAITTAMCTSFKGELLTATHNFSASGGNTFRLGLYAISGGGKSSTTATLGAATTAFTTTGEIASSGSYATASASANCNLTNVDPTTSSSKGFTDFSDISFTTATITARGALIFNQSQSNKAVCALDFGGNKTSTAGTFTVSFPAKASGTAIIRIE